MFSRSVAVETIQVVECLRLPAGRWAYVHLLPFQIHEKLHYYEKQNPTPILQGAAALAGDVSVPFWAQGDASFAAPWGQDSP